MALTLFGYNPGEVGVSQDFQQAASIPVGGAAGYHGVSHGAGRVFVPLQVANLEVNKFVISVCTHFYSIHFGAH